MPNHTCCVPQCASDARKKRNLEKHPWMENVKFYPFPCKTSQKMKGLRAKWLRAICRPDKWRPTRHSRVCSRHFSTGGFCPDKNPVPDIFTWKENHNPGEPQALNHDKREVRPPLEEITSQDQTVGPAPLDKNLPLNQSTPLVSLLSGKVIRNTIRPVTVSVPDMAEQVEIEPQGPGGM